MHCADVMEHGAHEVHRILRYQAGESWAFGM